MKTKVKEALSYNSFHERTIAKIAPHESKRTTQSFTMQKRSPIEVPFKAGHFGIGLNEVFGEIPTNEAIDASNQNSFAMPERHHFSAYGCHVANEVSASSSSARVLTVIWRP